LLKHILRALNSEKNIFLYGNADFSVDIKKYISENDVLIFRYVNPMVLSHDHVNNHESTEQANANIDLAVIGDCGLIKNNIYNINNHHSIDINRLGNINSVLLNIDNSGGVNYSKKGVQIITCGLKEKDTAIFSSINLDESNVILDLQRSIKNIYGETVEPFEKQIDIPNFAASVKTEDLILAFTALAFCGRI